MNKHRRKTLELASFGKGAFAGGREHRYGQGGKITLPLQEKPKPLLDDEKRKKVVSLIMDSLKDWRFSPFEREGACRAGLRASFCLEGNGWEASDREATEIVGDALRRMGAKRPAGIEGQPHYAAGEDYCAWCATPMGQTRRARGQMHCSGECARNDIRYRGTHKKYRFDDHAASAYNLIRNLAAPSRHCKFCAKEFQSYQPKQQFCSVSCSTNYAAGDRILPERGCDWCAGIYKPATKKHLFCSQSCASHSRLEKERQRMASVRRKCECCGTEFVPKAECNKYCTPQCGQILRAKKRHETQRRIHNHTCQWCESTFTSKMPWAMYCSREHKDLARKLAKQTPPANNVIYLTAAMFDQAFGRQESVPAKNALSQIIVRLFA